MSHSEDFGAGTAGRSNIAQGGGMHVEGGAAFAAELVAPPTRKQVIVIGGGQAGLSVGYHLKRLGIDFLILDAAARIGDAWRRRWDSLRLFTPARYDGLNGMPFPASKGSYPSKDEMANYLESYAKRFALPVLSGMRVESLTRSGGRFRILAGGRKFEADQVIVAMSN